MFLQIHTLTSYHATLLNRDDAGLAKRIPFGDAVRLRISSQCLKRHWSEKLREILNMPTGIRSRQFFGREILPRAISAGVVEKMAHALVLKLAQGLIKGEGLDEETLELKQPVLFGKPEADYFVSIIKECASAKNPEKEIEELLKTDKKNFRAMLKQSGHGDVYAGIEGALFGRFVTSDILSRSDSCVHVANSFTVHALDTEVDFFTVVDDLNKEEETGAAHAGDAELGAGLYYGYVVVDIPLLVSNLTGCVPKDWVGQDSNDSVDVLRGLIRTIATASPGAKLGSTAPYSYSDLVLLETGRQQPRSLSNAYLRAMPLAGDSVQKAVDTMMEYLAGLDLMYGKTSDARKVASTRNVSSGIAEKGSLEEAIEAIFKSIFKR